MIVKIGCGLVVVGALSTLIFSVTEATFFRVLGTSMIVVGGTAIAVGLILGAGRDTRGRHR